MPPQFLYSPSLMDETPSAPFVSNDLASFRPGPYQLVLLLLCVSPQPPIGPRAPAGVTALVNIHVWGMPEDLDGWGYEGVLLQVSALGHTDAVQTSFRGTRCIQRLYNLHVPLLI